jgi:anion-transporting  ArsA/GET3 family ATPase
MFEDPVARRLIVVLGKGGVGKTTVSAALARIAAARGLRALAYECDAHAPMAARLAVASRYEPTATGAGHWVARLDGRHALEEYLRLVVPGRALLRAVFASRLYQFFVQAAPGLSELMMLGKVYYELERKPRGREAWDVIVVDSMASGQALALLKMPSAARETFGDSIVGREARNIAELLRDAARTAIVLVTTAEQLAVAETVETFGQLAALRMRPAAIVLNRHRAVEFDERDIERVAAPLPRPLRERLDAIARAELARGRGAARALVELRRSTRADVVMAGDHPALAPAALVAQVAEELQSEFARQHAGAGRTAADARPL